MLWLAACALLVGALIGAAGVGGVLLIPAIAALAPLPMAEAMATALFTFVFTGIAGTWLFQRRGSIDWAATAPLCAGAAIFGLAGARASTALDGRQLALILAVLIAAAGAYTLLAAGRPRPPAFAGRPRRRRALLFAIGALTGFGSGLTGVGGPAISVPVMVLSGFSPLAAVGASQAVQVVAALSGSAGHLAHGSVSLTLAAPLAAVEVIGVFVGVRIAHAVDALALRRAVGALCLAVGAGMAIRVA